MHDDRQETEVRNTEIQEGNTSVQRQSVAHTERTPGVVLIQRVIWFIAGVISVIIALRFILLLLGANREAGFTDLVYSVSSVFVAPFTGMFGQPTYGTSVFEISSLLAVVIYLLVAWGVVKLFTITRPKEEV